MLLQNYPSHIKKRANFYQTIHDSLSLSKFCLNQNQAMLSKFHKASDKARRFLQNKVTLFVRNLTMTKNTSKVQALYDLCNTTFTPSPSGASPPSSQALQRLCSLLDTFGPADVGLKEELSDDDRGHGISGLNQLNRAARWAQPITYLDVFECDSFTMCIFCFPTSAIIPLHDHPEMTVFSKVLYGSMHVKAYDWVEPAQIQEIKGPTSFPVRLAKLSVDKVLTAPCGTTVLYPKSGGNLHCFTAVTPCAILDILSPPYKEEAGRKCNYYHDYPYSTISARNESFVRSGKEEDYAWLEQIETPDDLYMRQGKYAGPAIQF